MLCVGCQKVDNSHVIEVDLSETGTEIVYSQFVDSVDIKTLNLPEVCRLMVLSTCILMITRFLSKLVIEKYSVLWFP